jgi:hypothetical protein
MVRLHTTRHANAMMQMRTIVKDFFTCGRGSLYSPLGLSVYVFSSGAIVRSAKFCVSDARSVGWSPEAAQYVSLPKGSYSTLV